MIVVCGDFGPGPTRGTSAQAVAGRAAAAGAAVQAVAVVPDDPAGDQRLFELAGAGVGHVAVLRGPARALDPADVDLALRYLTDVRVVVAVGLAPAAAAAAAERASWTGASLVVIRSAATSQEPDPDELPESAIVLQAPPSDPDATFAGFVGAFAARMDGGATPADAWAATTRALAVDPA